MTLRMGDVLSGRGTSDGYRSSSPRTTSAGQDRVGQDVENGFPVPTSLVSGSTGPDEDDRSTP